MVRPMKDVIGVYVCIEWDEKNKRKKVYCVRSKNFKTIREAIGFLEEFDQKK